MTFRYSQIMRKLIVELKIKEDFSNIIIPKIALPIQEKIKEYILMVL